MPIKFSDLAKATKAATFDLPDGAGTICFRFRHGLITPRMIQQVVEWSDLSGASAAETAAALMSISQNVARLVTEWDVMEDDGVTMFPLDAARLAADIPLTVQSGLMYACFAEMQMGEASAPAADSQNKPRSGATS